MLLRTQAPSSSLFPFLRFWPASGGKLTDSCYTSRHDPCVSGKKVKGQRAVPADYDHLKELSGNPPQLTSTYISLLRTCVALSLLTAGEAGTYCHLM